MGCNFGLTATEIFSPFMVFSNYSIIRETKVELPIRSQIIVREIQIVVSHRSVTSTDLGELGVKNIYRKSDLTREGMRLFL